MIVNIYLKKFATTFSEFSKIGKRWYFELVIELSNGSYEAFRIVCHSAYDFPIHYKFPHFEHCGRISRLKIGNGWHSTKTISGKNTKEG